MCYFNCSISPSEKHSVVDVDNDDNDDGNDDVVNAADDDDDDDDDLENEDCTEGLVTMMRFRTCLHKDNCNVFSGIRFVQFNTFISKF